MKFNFFRFADDGDARDKRGDPQWVKENSDGLTQRYIHIRCLQLTRNERYEDVKAIQDEFLLDD